MPISTGAHLGPYEIIAPIGAGGMGEVYRAHDTRLRRDVAIKICNENFSERFEREARSIAALNHPHICQLYDIGPNYLVMELIEGEPLKGPYPLDEALRFVAQIAEALEAAHEKGIVHRDLKPANIMITPGGIIKVLDFGLAKAAEDPAAGNPQNSPTITMSPTRAGMILGTAAYMAPEQARGKAVDKRADIWAFGVVLYEMLTGKQLFHGETAGDTLAAVLKEEPNLDRVPAKVRPLLRRCLEKDPKKRLRDIGDWALLLANADAIAPSRSRAGWIAAGALALVAVVAASLWMRGNLQPPRPLMRFEVAPPLGGSIQGIPQISPDGQTLAFVASTPEKPNLIYLRQLGALEERPLAGTEGAIYCFWAPDGRSLGFNTRELEVKRIDLGGGGPRVLTSVNNLGAFNGTWGQQGDILTHFGGENPVVQRIASSGGTITAVTRLDPKRQETSHRFPQFLPDGKHFLFYAFGKDQSHNTVELATLGSFERKTILEGVFAAVYTRGPEGDAYLLYYRDATLMAQRFDESAGRVTGEAVVIADNVGGIGTAAVRPVVSASSSGTLVYAAGSDLRSLQLTWFDRQGKALDKVAEPGAYREWALSSDGARVAFSRFQPLNVTANIWVLELARGVNTRLTFGATEDRSPVWSPDGKRIVFRSNRGGRSDLYMKASDGTGDDELLLKSDQDKYPDSWPRDGRFLIYETVDPKTKADLWVLPMEGERKPFPFLRTEFNESEGVFSPDGRWIAYTSDESGREEVYVRPFTPLGAGTSAAGGKWQISEHGGVNAAWREDSRELDFLTDDGTWWSAEVSASPVFHAGTPRPLSRLPSLTSGSFTRDLKRVLLAAPAEDSAAHPITVVLNWQSGLKK